MIEISWGMLAVLVALVSGIGPGFYFIGRMSKQVDVNTRNIGTIFGKLDAIHEYVKNGGKRP